MSSTALGAEKEKAIIFISDAHEKFYYEKLKEVRYQDVYHKALVYCLGMDLCQYVGQKKSKDYAVFLSSSSSFCCGVK